MNRIRYMGNGANDEQYLLLFSGVIALFCFGLGYRAPIGDAPAGPNACP
jgi:hypothetical protein